MNVIISINFTVILYFVLTYINVGDLHYYLLLDGVGLIPSISQPLAFLSSLYQSIYCPSSTLYLPYSNVTYICNLLLNVSFRFHDREKLHKLKQRKSKEKIHNLESLIHTKDQDLDTMARRKRHAERQLDWLWQSTRSHWKS